MALNTIEKNGKIIYYNDWKNLKTPEQFKPKIDEGNKNTEQLIKEGKNDILTLTDVSNSFIYGETIKLLNEAAKLAKPITKKTATVGITGAKKTLLNGINLLTKASIKYFDTVDEALNWLVED